MGDLGEVPAHRRSGWQYQDGISFVHRCGRRGEVMRHGLRGIRASTEPPRPGDLGPGRLPFVCRWRGRATATHAALWTSGHFCGTISA